MAILGKQSGEPASEIGKVLVTRLRELESHGLVERCAVNRQVECGLAELGQSVLPLIVDLSEWVRMHADRLGEPVLLRCESPPT